jgi:hypothetical protein
VGGSEPASALAPDRCLGQRKENGFSRFSL